ncbi:RNA-directed DNA polymerase, eukaryota, reverse transcriptase zinc-binding domain protein [Tanacetum coccineum]
MRSTLSDFNTIQFTQLHKIIKRDLVLRRKKEKSLDYNNSFLGEYECYALALDREERRDEKKRLDHLKQDQTMLVIKRFSERKKIFKERKKTGKICAKRELEKISFGEEGVEEGKKLSWVKWDSVLTSFGDGRLNVGSLRAKNLALLGKWCWRFKREGGSLWVTVIKSFHGTSGGLGEDRELGRGTGGGAWNDIVRVGKEIDGLGLEFSSSCIGEVGDGRDIRFWVDRRKEGYVCDKGLRVNDVWCWEWEWVRSIRGRVSIEFEELLVILAKLVEEKILHVESGGQETLWNKLVLKKVNIFVWRALKGRLPVRVDLDRRGINLDSVLCPCCNNFVETCAHCLVTCDLAMSVWEKIFNWWKVGSVNAFSLDELFSSNGVVNVPNFLAHVWQAVIWTSGYFIWKERNARVFGKKALSTNKIVQDIQLKSSEWIVLLQLFGCEGAIGSAASLLCGECHCRTYGSRGEVPPITPWIIRNVDRCVVKGSRSSFSLPLCVDYDPRGVAELALLAAVCARIVATVHLSLFPPFDERCGHVSLS